MTVLAEYQRLEAEGIWRASAEAQRRDVIVAIGEATITINAPNGTALTHWSLPAMRRLNASEAPAIYGPGADSAETLEIADPEMVAAIERVLAAIQKPVSSRGWTGRLIRLGVALGAIAGLIFWLPGAVTAYTASLVPDVAHDQIGAALLQETERVAGAPCQTPAGDAALASLSARLFPDDTPRLVILPTTLKETAHLPDGTILISHTLVEDFETPEVVAGFVLAEHLRANTHRALAELLEASPFRASLALLTTGRLRDVDLRRMAEWLVVKPVTPVSVDRLISAMSAREIATAPYGRAIDVTGENSAPYLTNTAQTQPVLSDSDWIALQTICAP